MIGEGKNPGSALNRLLAVLVGLWLVYGWARVPGNEIGWLGVAVLALATVRACVSLWREHWAWVERRKLERLLRPPEADPYATRWEGHEDRAGHDRGWGP